jgi:hypothetical protein
MTVLISVLVLVQRCCLWHESLTYATTHGVDEDRHAADTQCEFTECTVRAQVRKKSCVEPRVIMSDEPSGWNGE